jgi:4'-phosphopantetheinyl transferase
MLRLILAGYEGVEPSRLEFVQGTNGKPALTKREHNGSVRFNVSRSEGVALYAFARDHEIGIDIEQIREIPEMDQIVQGFLSKREHASFLSFPVSRKREVFFTTWTRKEAFVKATGAGLSFPLDRLDVSMVPGEPARLLGMERDGTQASRWYILDLKVVPGFAAALATRRPSCRIRYAMAQ